MALAAMAAPVAHAGWSPPSTIADGPHLEGPLLAMTAPGAANVGWVRGHTQELRTRRIGGRGKLRREVSLAPATASLAAGPWLAGVGRGGAVAVWYSAHGNGTYSINAGRLNAHGRLGAVRTVATGSDDVSTYTEALTASVALDRAGNATVVWPELHATQLEPKHFDITSATVHARSLRADGSLGPLLDVASPGEIDPAPEVAVDASGRATLAWRAQDPAGNKVVRAARLTPNGQLGAAHTLSTPTPSEPVGEPTVASNARGDVVAGWRSGQRIVTRLISANGVLGTLATIASSSSGFQVVIDSSGKATFAWRTNRAMFRQLSPGGRLGPLRSLSASSLDGSSPDLAVDRAGTITATWRRDSRVHRSAIQTRRIRPDGSAGAVRTLAKALSSSLGSPVVVADTQGAVVAWPRWVTATRSLIQVSRLVVRRPGREAR